MRRVCLMLACLVLVSVAVPACGRKSYEERLAKTLTQMEYARQLSKNLNAAPGDKKFLDLGIYVRPPKDEILAKTGQLTAQDDGRFELEASFNDKTDSALHLLARVKLAKKPAAKGAAAVTTPPAARGPFQDDVLGILTGVFAPNESLQTLKFADEAKKGNRYKRLGFTTPDKEVKLYILKQDNYDIALVFAYAPTIRNAIAKKIDLCLESFAIGEKAKRLLSGGTEEEPEGGGAAVPL